MMDFSLVLSTFLTFHWAAVSHLTVDHVDQLGNGGTYQCPYGIVQTKFEMEYG